MIATFPKDQLNWEFLTMLMRKASMDKGNEGHDLLAIPDRNTEGMLGDNTQHFLDLSYLLSNDTASG